MSYYIIKHASRRVFFAHFFRGLDIKLGVFIVDKNHAYWEVYAIKSTVTTTKKVCDKGGIAMTEKMLVSKEFDRKKIDNKKLEIGMLTGMNLKLKIERCRKWII